jgi:hypothetical protein
MTKKQFWQSASNWGLICGAALFLISILSWVIAGDTGKSARGMGWVSFVVVLAILVFSGRRNAAISGPQGYPYGRAVGWILAMMIFTGIVAGIGEFLMSNFIARDYYDGLAATQVEGILKMYEGTAMYDKMIDTTDMMTRMMFNPIILILGSVFGWVVKGGLLGLIVAAFVKKNPDQFAGAGQAPSYTSKDE